MLPQVGELASSKSAMKPRAPELSALMTIFREVGPVISTRRSCSASGTGATVKSSRRRHELERAAGVEVALAFHARGQQLPAAVVELAVEAARAARARPP